MHRLAGIAALTLLLVGCSAPVAHPRGLTEDELGDFVEYSQEVEWDAWGLGDLERPPIAPEFVGDRDEYNALSYQCIVDAGYGDSYSIVRGALFLRSGVEPSVEEKLAIYVCRVSYLAPAKYSGYFSRDELGYAYDYFRDSLVPCLEREGYDVSSGPTRDEFTATVGPLPWNPYESILQSSGSAVGYGGLEGCPYLPPELT